eukprot:gene12972-biopygen8534
MRRVLGFDVFCTEITHLLFAPFGTKCAGHSTRRLHRREWQLNPINKRCCCHIGRTARSVAPSIYGFLMYERTNTLGPTPAAESSSAGSSVRGLLCAHAEG